jgi:DNA-binding NtrC family response regulator/tetratricopeptide (TPR) repeat protein
MLLADRYLRCSGSWIDLATARVVLVALRDPGARRSQIDWAERCAMLARLRHPLLNPLIDFGVAGPTSLFEVYAPRGRLDASPSAARTVITHAMRFLNAHGIQLPQPMATCLLRPVERSRPGSGMRERPIGVVLQPRGAMAALEELLTAEGAPGTTTVRVAAGGGMGLRTLWTELARCARIEGFVPVCPEALERWPDVLEYCESRHVCVFTQDETTRKLRRAAAGLLARAARRGARPHLCLVAERSPGRGDGAIQIGAMGRSEMTSMVYVDPDYGPSAAEILDAVRQSEGSPGRFVSWLARAGRQGSDCGVTIHESSVEYGPSETAGTKPAPNPRPSEHLPSSSRHSRIGSVLWRAGTRATSLQLTGRHAAAVRLLTRAARALEGRGDVSQAARYWLQLGAVVRSRGALSKAHEYAARAARTDASTECQILAGLLDAACWTDDQCLVNAEAALRSLLASSVTLGNETLEHQCRLELARTLCWQGHPREAGEVLGTIESSSSLPIACAALTLRSRVLRKERDLAASLRTARGALALAEKLTDPSLLSRAHRELAEALGALGEIELVRTHVAQGIEAAQRGRLPLALLRMRAVLLHALMEVPAVSLEEGRLRAVLERARRRALPGLVAQAIDEALRRSRGALPAGPWACPGPVLVEAFLDLAQRARDDGEAVGNVAGEVCTRVGAAACVVAAADGRVVSAAGRPWRDGSLALAQVLAGGQRVLFDPGHQPPEAAEPIRCGGDLVGAIACRWVAGRTASPAVVADTLHAAAMAAATHLRALLEVSPAPPPGVWGDLLGESAAAVTLRDAVHRAARAPFPVLVEGESGSGKELVARAIHKLSPRHTRRFCAINCAALGDDLIEAELFGHARGAFTGAATERAGLFEEADGGTLFLDEVGELSARAQAKLLRVLQEGELRRVGENLPRRVDVRVVAATNRRLEREAAEGRFRVDLRFRLDVLRLTVPALRERPGDVPLLAQHFWRAAADRVGSRAVLGPDALAALSRYDWPGNVRELQNAIAWMAVHGPRRGRISASCLPAHLAIAPLATGSSFETAREDFERRFVRAALAQAGGQRHVAAKALGVTRQGLAKMLRRLRIEPPPLEPGT